MRYDAYQIEVAAAVTFTVACVGAAFFRGTTWLRDLAVAGAGIWTVYRAVGGLLYGKAREAWVRAAESLEIAFHEPRLGEYPASSTLSDGIGYFVMFLANSRRNFTVDGRVDGVSVEAACEPDGYGRATVFTADLPEAIPEWLQVREAWSVEVSDDWMAPRDIPVGERQFDEVFLVQGPDVDAVRGVFEAHPVTDLLLSMSERFGDVQIADGELRVVEPGVVKDSEALVAGLERFADYAGLFRRRGVADGDASEGTAEPVT